MPPEQTDPQSHPPLSPAWRAVVRLGLLGASALLVAVGLAVFILFGCKSGGGHR